MEIVLLRSSSRERASRYYVHSVGAFCPALRLFAAVQVAKSYKLDSLFAKLILFSFYRALCVIAELPASAAASITSLPYVPKIITRSINMIFDWFNAGEAVLFAQEIVRDINRLFPPADQKGKAIPAKEYKRKFDGMIIRIRTFSQKYKLNIYKKAKLLNTIKWEMRDAGHEDVIINEFISFIAPLL